MGDSKSAFDMLYAMVRSGGEVDLIIRPDSNDPVWTGPPRPPIKSARGYDLQYEPPDLVQFPCPGKANDHFEFARRLLEKSRVGRTLVRIFWGSK